MSHYTEASQKGYPREWFAEDCQRSIDQKGLNCSLCKLVLRDAVQVLCGSRFCRTCYEGLFKDVPLGPVMCPQCAHDEDVEDSLHLVPNEYQADNFCRNQVKHLTVRCTYLTLGCDWTGNVIDYEEHVRVHNDPVSCVCGHQCSNDLEYRHHLATDCQKAAKTPVPNPPCSACENDKVLSPGHIVFMCSEVNSLRTALAELSKQSIGHHEKLQGNSLSVLFNEKSPADPESRAVAKSSQYETLINKNKANTTLITVLYNEVKTCTQKLVSMENESINSDVADLKQRVTLLDRIATDAQSKWQANERQLLDGAVHNTNGRLTWRIDNVRQRMEEARSGAVPTLYSTPFFTCDAGYKACARLYLNGDGIGKGSHLSLFFVVMKGCFDAILPWPFTHRVNMLLLDQSGQGHHVQVKFRPDTDSPSFHRPRSEENIGTGSPQFISQSELERRKSLYMKENTMFIQMIVE